MKIINADVEFITPIDGAAILKRLEQCGRVCYKSEAKITDTSAPAFVAGIIKRGHEAVLEHCSFTVKFICDRGVSHEIVRHRLAAYCQESTRYCNYSKDGFGNEITVIAPCFFNDSHSDQDNENYLKWKAAMKGGGVTTTPNTEKPATGGTGATVKPYLVRVTIPDLYIRKGPGTNYGKNGFIKPGVYTIVEERTGAGASKWGKLKSGAGWISLDYAKKA